MGKADMRKSDIGKADRKSEYEKDQYRKSTGMINRQEIRNQLEQAAEPDYQEFQAKLLPGVSGILGVRVPKLREMAKWIAKADAHTYLHEMNRSIQNSKACGLNCENPSDGICAELCYEEKMLYGLVIGYAKMDDAQRKEWLDLFVPVIDSWGVCDSCCLTYKWMKKQSKDWWEYLNKWILTDSEYGIRFGLVSMLDHFVDEQHIQQIFAVCDKIYHHGYYVKMAQAWLISMCFVKFPEQTYQFLQKDKMDDFTHNKAIQKTCESYRVSKEWKETVRSLKRSYKE